MEEISHHKKDEYFNIFIENLSSYFKRISSPGTLLVEQENGPDAYIDDLRQDIFERFNTLRGLTPLEMNPVRA